ncbi:MAG: hypothetical protein UR66_C0009G0031 [Candidatus Moranbacteria bacterium GW2011_GWE1_35_17]|nr:MAG: hypothetical protein UR66_C0009G0031 [Candidatus Moranbacteria bacterium GW2011_GWE1_35_17]KKP84051.1 MAG: hypothetical protein UR83_C0028G0007 [Candidatus Moranbacteria bacterium GW2011_GWF2_35_54]KKP84411.1 MAG: hypothetical protein UR82_C0007G0010 [Candidatus Moranbacteria bacterium GW2011_GWF1_35_5]
MKTVNILIVLLLVVFANFFEAEAGIIDQTYDAATDEMLIKYEILKGDTIWTTYNGMTIKLVGMKFIEENVMAPNNIADPKKIGIRDLLKYTFKRDNFKDPVTGTVLTRESLVAKYPQITKMKVDPLLNAAKSVSAVPVGFSGVSKSAPAEIKPPVEKGELVNGGQEEIIEDLKRSLEAANVKITAFEKIFIDNGKYILSIEEELKMLKSKMRTKEAETPDQKSIQNGLDAAVVNFNQERNRWLVVAGLIIICLILYLSYSAIENIRSRYHPRRERGRNGPNESSACIN